jgi:hypothetical protein
MRVWTTSKACEWVFQIGVGAGASPRAWSRALGSVTGEGPDHLSGRLTSA